MQCDIVEDIGLDPRNFALDMFACCWLTVERFEGGIATSISARKDDLAKCVSEDGSIAGDLIWWENPQRKRASSRPRSSSEEVPH